MITASITKRSNLLIKFITLFTIFMQLSITQYIAATFAPSSYIINQYTTYQITLYRNNNPITSQFISPVSTVPSTAYIQIYFPPSYLPVSSTGTPTCSNTAGTLTFSCSVNEVTNVLTINNVFTNSAQNSAEVLYIQISQIKNPSRAQSSGNFQYYIKYSNGTIIDQSPSAGSNLFSTAITLLSATFTSCGISGNNNYISTRSRFTYTITVNNAIPTDGQLYIDIPINWNGDLQYSNTVTSTPTCTPISGVSQPSCSYTIILTPVNVARIIVSTFSTSGIAAGAQFVLDISSILTPPYTNSVDQIKISSQWADGVVIDTCSTTVKNTIPIPFSSTTFVVQSGSTVVQSKFTAKLTLTLAKSFSYQDQIWIKVPTNFLTNNQISISSSNYAIFSTTVQSSVSNISTVILSNFPSSPSILPANNIFNFLFTDIYNYQSVQPQTITITFYRYSQKYQESSTSYSSTTGTFTSFTVASDNAVVNNVGPALVSISSQFKIPAAAYIQLVYNSYITASDISISSVASSALNGVRVNGALYQTNQGIITVTNLFQSAFLNGTIEVKIPLLTNPPTIKPTPYSIAVKSSSGYLIASSSFTFTSSLQPFKSGSATLIASSYIVMDSTVTYTLQFQTFYGYNSISILIPPEVTVNSGYQTTCSPNTYTSCSIANVGTQGYKNLTFMGSITAGVKTISWGNNINPNSFSPTSPFQLYTYLGGWGVEKSTGYTILTMNQQAQVLSVQAVPSSYTNNGVISLSISYILPAQSPTGTVSITVPSVIQISNSLCSVTNNSTCTIIPPNVLITFNSLDNTTTKSFTLTLSNVKNAISLKPVPSFSISLKTSNNYKSLASTFSGWTNVDASSFTTTVSSNIGYRGQNAVFSLSLTGLPGSQTYVNLKINSNFQALTAAPIGGTLISPYQVRYSIFGESSTSLSLTLQTPVSIGDYTFSLRTFTSDEYLIGQSISNVWRHSCYGTQCRACIGTTCINCYNSSLTNYYIFNTADSTCIRACSIGFYLISTTNNCVPCVSNCLECINSSSTCTKCPIYTNTTPSTIYYLNTVFNTCVLQCSTSYFPNNFTQQCALCVQPCYTCSDQSTCLTCMSNFYLLNTTRTCVSSCPASKMVKNDVSRTCDYCSDNCLTCSVFAYNCTSCNNSVELYLDVNVCVTQCSTQKFLKNNICTSCQSPCRICYNSTTTCSSCFPNTSLYLWYDYKCITESECAIGHYINSTNGSCNACPSQCLQCVSLTNCSTCADGFYLYANTCITPCPNITYPDNSVKKCQACIGCVTCTSESVCTSCVANYYLYLSGCLSNCPTGTFPTNQTVSGVTRKICVVCSAGCPTCTNLTYCLSCLPSQNLYKGICYTDCPISTYPSSPNCLDCPATCQTCTATTNCLTCVTGYSLQNAQCVLNCAFGISYNQVCYPCGLNCAICTNTTCTRCVPTFYLQNNVCVSQCSQNTLALDGMNCVLCANKYVNCSTCNTTHCLSCFDGQLTNGQCIPCIPGYYTHNSKCVLCPTSCALCFNQTYCTSCSSGFYQEATFCVSTCPNNKIPNGTKCDVCVSDCAQCNLVTSGCSICNAGYFQFEGYCVTQCPSPYVTNLNYTLCITQEQYSQQYSKASKPIYFPFTIAVVVVLIIGIALKFYISSMHIITFLVSVVAWIQLICWIIFGVIQYIFYSNLQTNALNGVILVVAALGILILFNLIFLRFYYKYFVPDMDFIKWERRHSCINIVFVVLGSVFSFRAHRMIYSKVMDRDQLSLQLSSIKKLIPINVISFISMILAEGAILAGTALAIYNSISQDQQFYNALDTLVVTGIMIFLLLLDLRHPPNYFIDQHETKNIKNKMYHEDYQEFDLNKKGEKYKDVDQFQKASNISRENLLEVGADTSGNIMDNMATAKKFRAGTNSKNQKIEGTQPNQTVRQDGTKFTKRKQVSGQQQSSQNAALLNNQKQNQYKEENLQIDQDQDILKEPSTNHWIEKKYDAHGYLIKHDQNNNPVKYDENGYRVEIDQNGNHKKYNQEGHLMKYDQQKDRYVPYDQDNLIVGPNGQRLDQRGYLVKKVQDKEGNVNFKYYDQHGFEVIKDKQTGQQMKIDEKGNRVVIDPQTKKPKFFNKEGYEILYSTKPDQKDLFKDPNTNQYVRLNEKTKKWQQYDPKDNFLLKKNQETGQYQKFDQHGFKIQYDHFGNVYRYDSDKNRIVLGPNGQIKRFDKEGYQIKRDPLTGQVHRYDKEGYEVKLDPETGDKILYDQNGYRVQKDFYGKVTLYDGEGNMILIDPITKKHRKFNHEGLQIMQDERGNKYLMDKRGRKVVELQDGYYEKYDDAGNKIWLDQQGFQVQTDEHGNITKYDKVGDIVSQQQQQNEAKGQDNFYLDEGQGDNAANQKPQQKQKKVKKFKMAKEYNFQQQYSKMLQQQNKPHLLFNFEDDQFEDTDNLRQFHDVQPVTQYQLEKQYQTLYNMEAQNQYMKRQQSDLRIKLEELQEVDNTPYKNLKQRLGKKKSNLNINRIEDQFNQSDLMMQPEDQHDKLQLKSVADVSISQRSFNNDGVQPLSQKNKRHQQQDMESMEEIDAVMKKNKRKRTGRSQADLSNQQKKIKNGGDISGINGRNSGLGTRSQQNYLNKSSSQKNNVMQQKPRKIFDSDQQVASLGQQQQWQNQNPDIFYKDNRNSNQNTNTHDKGIEEEQSDILSDYIPQPPLDSERKTNKASEQNLFHKKYMQSIEQVEDQLFDKLKSEDNRVKRTQFKLSGKPNPLLQYAKTIDAKKMQEERQKQTSRRQRYDPKNNKNRR